MVRSKCKIGKQEHIGLP